MRGHGLCRGLGGLGSGAYAPRRALPQHSPTIAPAQLAPATSPPVQCTYPTPQQGPAAPMPELLYHPTQHAHNRLCHAILGPDRRPCVGATNGGLESTPRSPSVALFRVASGPLCPATCGCSQSPQARFTLTLTLNQLQLPKPNTKPNPKPKPKPSPNPSPSPNPNPSPLSLNTMMRSSEELWSSLFSQ